MVLALTPLAADSYEIDIDGALAQIGVQLIVDQCFAPWGALREDKPRSESISDLRGTA